MRPKPVDLPPPKWVRNLKTKMVLGSFTSYTLASLSFNSAYTENKQNNPEIQARSSRHMRRAYRTGAERSHLGNVGAAGVDHLKHLQDRGRRGRDLVREIGDETGKDWKVLV